MSILIGLHISRALGRNPAISGKVADRIYPLLAKQGVDEFPFIVYDTSGGTGTKTKDGTLNDIASVSMSVIAKTYGEALSIGNEVRYALDGYCPIYDEFKVCGTENIVYNDEYVEAIDAYSLNISMDFKTIDF